MGNITLFYHRLVALVDFRFIFIENNTHVKVTFLNSPSLNIKLHFLVKYYIEEVFFVCILVFRGLVFVQLGKPREAAADTIVLNVYTNLGENYLLNNLAAEKFDKS